MIRFACMEVAGNGPSFVSNAVVDAFGLVCMTLGFVALLCIGVPGEGLTALVCMGVEGDGFAVVRFPAVGCAGIGVAGEGFLWVPGFVPVPDGAEFAGPDFPAAAGGLRRGASGDGALRGAVLRGW